MKNHTPRTQDVINRIADNPDNLQPIFDHARRLEIELNAAKELQRELAAAKLDCGHAEKRCDAAIASWDEERERALREGARVVELKARAERAEAELATCRESLHLADGTANLALVHRDAAEAELALLKPKYERHCREYNNKLAELRYAENMQRQAEAELAAERARLDWLESNAGVDWQWSDAARTVSRASIDAFMKEEIK